jgi:drug/metabolite transporter (DMT)-like permease
MFGKHGELLLWAAAVLTSGTLCTVVLKIQFNFTAKGTQMCAGGSYVCPFDKPWFAVAEMKVAMFMCLVYLGLKQAVMGKKKRPFLETPRASRFGSIQRGFKEESKPLLGDVSSDGKPSLWRMAMMVAVPSLLDIIQTVCGNIGLLFVSSSVYQMCRGSLVIFSAVLSVYCLGKKLHRYHVFSVFLVLVAGAKAHSRNNCLPLTQSSTRQLFCARSLV